LSSLTVVIPVYNEREQIPHTIGALLDEVAGSGFADVQILVVDDGSTDGTAAAVASLGLEQVEVLRQSNQGRLAARRSGLAAARGDHLLFLDSRVRVVPGSLSFVAGRVKEGQEVWNGHVRIETAGNPYGKFWNVLTELAFAGYFGRPRTTSFGAAEFDAFPKGTTCFLAPTGLLREAFGRFQTRYSDQRHANDDTPILRWLAAQTAINISPSFACRYRPRDTFRGFWKHAVHRGVVFLDGHARPESRFFLPAVAFYPGSLLLTGLALRRPRAIPLLAAGAGAAAGLLAVAKRRRPAEVASFALLAPVYALAHGLGMWQGLAMILADAGRGALEKGKP
jgi:glycosyltransferase involved in cell wall biosynthesis